ncbi:hypothetical protein vBVhaSVHB1_117 [Vibrio phage vB_VhaS-VHB1]|nr:hypothetical protein vBVhaSVHB1_117 [Vibrio phage vB_VhaS-VHB1]
MRIVSLKVLKELMTKEANEILTTYGGGQFEDFVIEGLRLLLTSTVSYCLKFLTPLRLITLLTTKP